MCIKTLYKCTWVFSPCSCVENSARGHLISSYYNLLSFVPCMCMWQTCDQFVFMTSTPNQRAWVFKIHWGLKKDRNHNGLYRWGFWCNPGIPDFFPLGWNMLVQSIIKYSFCFSLAIVPCKFPQELHREGVTEMKLWCWYFQNSWLRCYQNLVAVCKRKNF